MGIANITGTTLHLALNYREKTNSNSPTGTDHPLPAAASSLLQTPLSAMFDQFWSINKDVNGKTQRDTATDQVVQELTAKGASHINGEFPATGMLQAASGLGSFVIDGTEVKGNLFLTYTLPNANFSFHLGPKVAPDITAWRLTFDAALELLIDVPDRPEALKAVGLFTVKNANISPDNFAARAATFAVDTFLPLPNSLTKTVGSSIDQSKGLVVDQFNTLLGQLTLVFESAVLQGFLHLRATVDNLGLTLQLIHPVDAAPQLIDVAQLPTFQGQVLAVGQNQVKAGEQLVVTGSRFTPAHADALNIEWNDTISGQIVASDIEWTPLNGSTQSAHVSREPSDKANSFRIPGLIPSTALQIRVRDCDALTCTNWSVPLATKTASSNQVILTLQSNSTVVGVGQTALGSDGSFSLLVVIPASAAVGPHQLRAAVGDENAATLLQVIASGQVAHPLISVINSETGEASHTQVTGIIEQEQVTVRGENFLPGLVELHVDTGRALGTATALTSGLFTTHFIWPAGVTGNHEIVASELVGGTIATQATTPVLVQSLPR